MGILVTLLPEGEGEGGGGDGGPLEECEEEGVGGDCALGVQKGSCGEQLAMYLLWLV